MGRRCRCELRLLDSGCLVSEAQEKWSGEGRRGEEGGEDGNSYTSNRMDLD